jgi:hypothetical protein
MENVSAVYAGNTVYAITAGGDLYAWGSNIYGQTGSGSDASVVTSPKRVLSGVKMVSASWTSLSAFAILKTGALYGWGGNHLGQLGFQSEEDSGYIEAAPIQIVEHERKAEETPVRVSTPSSWAEDEVSAALKMGIVPDDIQSYYQAYILRIEFSELIVKTIERVTGKTMPTGAAFDDCTDTLVLKARAAGIVNGKDGNNFDPWNEITREEMAKMIINAVRYLEDFSNREYIKEYTGSDSGILSGVSAWAVPYMKLAYANDYIKGDGVSLAPQDSTSCEQAILIVYRAVKAM